MFASSVLTVLEADMELVSYLSTHRTRPAIFVDSAPEGADFNYLVFTIADTGNEEDSCLDAFVITFDFFGYEKSGTTARRAMKRIIQLLDRTHLTHADYDNIRLFKGGVDFVESGDPKAQHYVIRFSARAGRSEWMNNL
jgi:hypothetical protein